MLFLQLDIVSDKILISIWCNLLKTVFVIMKGEVSFVFQGLLIFLKLFLKMLLLIGGLKKVSDPVVIVINNNKNDNLIDLFILFVSFK